jgi:hypothetical protein
MRRCVEEDYPPLMMQQIQALRDYAGRHGRPWKRHLCREWMNATAEPLLHRLRNTHGPSWLDKFKLPD